MKRLAGDNRGLANRLIIFGGFLVITALLMLTLDPAFQDVSNQTATLADSSQGQEGLSYVNAAWSFAPMISMMLAVVMLIAGALVESRRGV